MVLAQNNWIVFDLDPCFLFGSIPAELGIHLRSRFVARLTGSSTVCIQKHWSEEKDGIDLRGGVSGDLRWEGRKGCLRMGKEFIWVGKGFLRGEVIWGKEGMSQRERRGGKGCSEEGKTRRGWREVAAGRHGPPIADAFAGIFIIELSGFVVR